MSHLLISALSAYKWPLAVLRTWDFHEDTKNVGQYVLHDRIRIIYNNISTHWNLSRPSSSSWVVEEDVVLCNARAAENLKTKWRNVFFRDQEKTSSKMCLCTTFCANSLSARRRPFKSSGSLSKALLVGTSRVWPSFSVLSPTLVVEKGDSADVDAGYEKVGTKPSTSSAMPANSRSCRNLENSALPWTRRIRIRSEIMKQ